MAQYRHWWRSTGTGGAVTGTGGAAPALVVHHRHWILTTILELENDISGILSYNVMQQQ
jgi:hypothetical protein